MIKNESKHSLRSKFLNVVNDFASTVAGDREFQAFVTLKEKKFRRVFSLGVIDFNFQLCPLVFVSPSGIRLKNLLILVSTSLCKIL